MDVDLGDGGRGVQVTGRVRNAVKRWFRRLEELARRAKRDGLALYLATRDPRVPWAVKAFAVLVAAYVLSPIDLIPDFIPVIGFLDELILLPLVVGLIVRSVDPAVMAELRAEAARLAERPRSRLGAALILVIWATLAGLAVWMLWPRSD
ncbi:YkvA family protein [Hyphomicrobium zavarzinii]|uniref:YkvA family protein n=1 Tax=Hyphomicrobium zavarzinii TaxID=48292 RepID=UPI000371AD54|nr:YkvA family protein [Hyphomicrobium zavarzinii]